MSRGHEAVHHQGRMIRLTIRDLIDLVASGVPNPESRLEKVYDWAHARRLELVKWLLASAVALFAPVMIALARGDLGPGASGSIWWLASALFGAVSLAVAGAFMLVQTRRRYRAYLAAQALLGEIRKIAPFLQRYRQESESQ
jgi:hypothetical protein